MSKEKPVLFKSFLIDSIVEGNCFNLDGHGLQTVFKTQTRRDHKYDVGDLLWVKEQTYISSGKVFYRRDKNFSCGDSRNWKSPMFMLKEHARIWLEVTGVRQEKLSEISRDDCFKEGIIIFSNLFETKKLYGWKGCEDLSDDFHPNIISPQEAFFDLIRFITGNKKFDSEDWMNKVVWVHDFKVVAK